MVCGRPTPSPHPWETLEEANPSHSFFYQKPPVTGEQ